MDLLCHQIHTVLTNAALYNLVGTLGMHKTVMALNEYFHLHISQNKT